MIKRYPWVLPILSTTILYGIAYLVSLHLFNIAIVLRRIPADFAILLAFSMLVFALSRRVTFFLILQTLLIATLYVGSAAKSAMMSRPLMPEDIYSLDAFIKLMGPLGWLVAGLPCLLILALFFGNLNFRGRHRQLTIIFSVVVVLGVGLGSSHVVNWMDRVWGDKPWDQRENYVWRGGTIHILQELVRVVALSKPVPSAQTVNETMDRRLEAAEVTASTGRRRNLHMVLEESFWDPTPLTAAGLKQSALDPRFLALWKEAGRSTTLSPAFGGQTANAEFEVLCGFPLAQAAVRFEQPMNDNLPCLPRLLSNAGYRTVAAHPNIPSFWNRQVSYERLGFETFWSIEDFILDDMTAIFLSDASLHRQVAQKLVAEKLAESADKRPIFDYTVTYYGHWMYDIDDKRPLMTASQSAVDEVNRYISVVHWKSREMMDAIENWRREDPDSIIVIFGDHLPLLGQNLAGYIESGFMGKAGDDAVPDIQARSTETPLIIIDGRKGALPVGRLPMYRLPSLLLGLLGENQKGMTDLAAAPTGLTLRPLPGLVVGYTKTGAPFLCRGADRDGLCASVADWQEDINLLAHDIFAGNGHALDRLSGDANP